MNDNARLIVEELAAAVEIPDADYDTAEARYQDLAEWFGRPEAACSRHEPHIYPQGSFRLGTVVRAEEYDLDFGCRLRTGVTKSTHTQKQLKELVGSDMEAYRQARHIKNPLMPKPRCWRLQYQEERGMSFHMDGVPSIPLDDARRQDLSKAMTGRGTKHDLAQSVAKHAGSITDNRLPNYESISPEWLLSNSEGYALWFESRVRLAARVMKKRAAEAKEAKIDELPARKWKSPLQKSIQILKHHRDVMFADSPDGKPISIIITTLAAAAYRGEEDVATALRNLLAEKGGLVNSQKPRVPNPVNPVEDFADKWDDPKYAHLSLERNFRHWLQQAQEDLAHLEGSVDPEFLEKQLREKFGATVESRRLRDKLGLGSATIVTSPKTHRIADSPARPWVRG